MYSALNLWGFEDYSFQFYSKWLGACVATFFCKKPNSSISGSTVHTVLIVTTQLCPGTAKAATGHSSMNKCGCGPIKLFKFMVTELEFHIMFTWCEMLLFLTFFSTIWKCKNHSKLKKERVKDLSRLKLPITGRDQWFSKSSARSGKRSTT